MEKGQHSLGSKKLWPDLMPNDIHQTRLGSWLKEGPLQHCFPCLPGHLLRLLQPYLSSASALSASSIPALPPGPVCYLGKTRWRPSTPTDLSLNGWKIVTPPSYQAAGYTDTGALQLQCFLRFTSTTGANVDQFFFPLSLLLYFFLVAMCAICYQVFKVAS